jgi:hypothetical protein
MEEIEEHEPYVFIDDEEAEAPRRRFPWIWGALAGTILLAALGALTFFHGRRPMSPPPPPLPAEEIAFVDADPVSPEDPESPAEPAHEDAPVVLPPPPAPTPPKAELPVVAVAPAPAAKEAPAAPPPPAPVERVKSPPAPEEPLSFVKGLASAAAAIGEARPLLFEVVDHFDPPEFQKGDVLELAAKMDRVEERLKLALGIYSRLRTQVPDPWILDQRLEAIRDLLEALAEGRARIRVPFALKKASVLQEEAVPLAKEALNGFQPYSREAQALDVRAEVAAAKLQEARRLYESIRKDVPDPERVDQRLKAIDSLLGDLEGRYPQMSAR